MFSLTFFMHKNLQNNDAIRDKKQKFKETVILTDGKVNGTKSNIFCYPIIYRHFFLSLNKDLKIASRNGCTFYGSFWF